MFEIINSNMTKNERLKKIITDISLEIIRIYFIGNLLNSDTISVDNFKLNFLFGI